MLLSAVSVLVFAQSSSEIPEGLMNNPVDKKCRKFVLSRRHLLYCIFLFVTIIACQILCMVCLISEFTVERRNASRVEAVSATCCPVGYCDYSTCRLYELSEILQNHKCVILRWFCCNEAKKLWCLFIYYILTYLLTYSMEQSPSWEANRVCR